MVTILVIAIALYIMYIKGYCCWRNNALAHVETVPDLKTYHQQQQPSTPSVILKRVKTNCIDVSYADRNSGQRDRNTKMAVNDPTTQPSSKLQDILSYERSVTNRPSESSVQFVNNSYPLPAVGYTVVRAQPISRSNQTISPLDQSRYRSKSADYIQTHKVRRGNKHKECKSLQSSKFKTSVSDYEVIKLSQSQNIPQQVFNHSISCNESPSTNKFTRSSTQVQYNKDKKSHPSVFDSSFKANSSNLSSVDEIEQEMSDFDHDSGRIDVGTIELSVIYNSLHNQLRVTVIKATRLQAKQNDGKDTINPYVKISLLPGRKHKQRSQVKRKTFNPQFNQTLILRRVSLDVLNRSILYVAVYDFDHFLKHDLIGEVFIPLNDNNKLRGTISSYNLRTKKYHLLQRDCGEICIALLNQTVSGHILITILKAHNLPPSTATNAADTYVKIYVLCDGRRLCKKKTRIIRNSLNPVFNQQFAVKIETQQLERTTTIIVLACYDRFMRSNNIGQVVLSLSRKGLEREHWYDVINSPHRQSAIWHKLHR
ncbi:synaptotagmin with longer linker [Trichoplax adhaerens]|uniref:Synaptotagmin with longer linker n=1 Tax=Trichoplax adhaerens TaxID=10228 RepID=B3RSE3_TRIAD|nr:synaptotagmin with longer linker [Trichoplax adhaerens]EDV26501.1 synaptotagmin with longer linker [Trichoplax adhaerens]|eukprot:XP_002110497.1 synaptotagmin with longer linker [Trichoplax adhaerens]